MCHSCRLNEIGIFLGFLNHPLSVLSDLLRVRVLLRPRWCRRQIGVEYGIRLQWSLNAHVDRWFAMGHVCDWRVCPGLIWRLWRDDQVILAILVDSVLQI